MRIVFFVFAVLLHASAFANPVSQLVEGINARLTEWRKHELSPKENVEARKLFEAFDRVKAAAGVTHPVTLVVVDESADVYAQSFVGATIVVNVSLARSSADLMTFILAHELGHVLRHDVMAGLALVVEHIPSDTTDAVLPERLKKLLPKFAALSHGFEHDADQFAAVTVIEMGLSVKDAQAFFAGLPNANEPSLSHPAPRDRFLKLKRYR